MWLYEKLVGLVPAASRFAKATRTALKRKGTVRTLLLALLIVWTAVTYNRGMKAGEAVSAARISVLSRQLSGIESNLKTMTERVEALKQEGSNVGADRAGKAKPVERNLHRKGGG